MSNPGPPDGVLVRLLESICVLLHSQWLPAQAKRPENARFEAGGGKNLDGTRMSRRPDGKARTRMQDEGRNIHTAKTAGNVPGHQINQRSGPVAVSLSGIVCCCSAPP